MTRRALLAGLAAVPLAGVARAEQLGDNLDVILARKSIRIAAYDDFAPYSFRDNGQIQGVDIEVGRLIAKAMKVEPEFELKPSGENTDGDLRSNIWKGPISGGDVVNLMLRIPYDKDLALRNDLVKLTGRYSVEKIALAFRWERLGQKPQVEMLRDFKTGVEIASTADYYLTNIVKGPGQSAVVHFRDMEAAMRSLARGDIDAVMGPLGQLEYGKRHEPKAIQIDSIMLPGLAYGRWTLCGAVRTNHRDLAYAVDDAVKAAIADGSMAAAFAKYGLSYTAPDNSG